MHVIYRKTCRVCGSSALTPVLDLGEQYLQGAFLKPNKQLPPQRKLPMALVRCDPTRDQAACGLLQMACTLPPEILYAVYWYRSGTNRTMRDHLKGIVGDAIDIVGKRTAHVLDIGCNDGTLLSYYPEQYFRFGVDPSDIAQGITENITVVRGLFPSEELAERAGGRPFDIITSIAMFYDLEDPVAFVKNIQAHLAQDGLWIVEMSYLPLMLEMTAYDTICHEHLEYYSLAVLEQITRMAGMRIFRATLNDINGGSIRCYVTHRNNFSFDTADSIRGIQELRQHEFEMELDADKPYQDFWRRVEASRVELRRLLGELKGQGKRIHIYGASTKGNVILQACGIDNTLIEYAAERNAEKFGAQTLGTNIPIISEEESRAMNPDYYLVLPWHFRKEFLEREAAALDRGVGMIFPLPQLEVVVRASDGRSLRSLSLSDLPLSV
jgi:SAM-dependent methyltransferase